MYVVEDDWFSVAGCFGQAYVPWYYGGEDLCPKEAAKVRGDLAGERCTLVIHGQQDTLDGQVGIQCSADPHQRVEEFRNAFERQVLALDGNQNGVASYQGVESY